MAPLSSKLIQIVISLFGILGAIKESQTVMWIWVGLDIILLFCNGLFGGVSTVLIAFTTFLTLMYACVLYKRSNADHSIDSNSASIKPTV